MGRYDEMLMCHVYRTAYDPVAGVGIVHIGAAECADMSGCIHHFQPDRPNIKQIDVIAGGFPVTKYVLAYDRWVATYIPPPPRPARERRQPAVVAAHTDRDGNVTPD
ncbi:hypothetical protein [Tabrizicola sp. BL-A-41-H6]|uniref:hypothetical protein n=1 Tax=Tabrizicola sp. BL-A-41-H6 TaxID=3421107 RepID=UPI003D6720D5